MAAQGLDSGILQLSQILTTHSPIVDWDAIMVKQKLPGHRKPVLRSLRDTVEEKTVHISGRISTEDIYLPTNYSFGLNFPGFLFPDNEWKKTKNELSLVDPKDGKVFRGFQLRLKGGLHERSVLDAVSSMAGLHAAASGISLHMVNKLLGQTQEVGGEVDLIVIIKDPFTIVQIESKSAGIMESIAKGCKQLRKGLKLVKHLVGTMNCKTSVISFLPLLYFGECSDRTSLAKTFPDLDENQMEHLLCSEDLSNIESIINRLSSVGSKAAGATDELDYTNVVKFFATAGLMSPVDSTGCITEWHRQLVGADLILPGHTVSSKSTKTNKSFSHLKNMPLSSDDSIMFWSKQQCDVIFSLLAAILIIAPYGGGKTQIQHACMKHFSSAENTTCFYISGLELDYNGSNLESEGGYIMDIITSQYVPNYITPCQIRKELGIDSEDANYIITRFILGKIEEKKDGQRIVFLIDEFPLRKNTFELHWTKVVESLGHDCLVRLAVRPTGYSKFQEMRTKNQLSGFTPVVLNKIYRNTERVATAAGKSTNDNYNFPDIETEKSSVLGETSDLILVKEMKDRIPVGLNFALTALQLVKDNAVIVILCPVDSTVLEVQKFLQSNFKQLRQTVFLMDTKAGEEKCKAIKKDMINFYLSPNGVLVTTKSAFQGMEASIVLCLDERKIGDEQSRFRAVSKYVQITKWENAENYEDGERDWNVWNGHTADKTTISQFKSEYGNEVTTEQSHTSNKELRLYKLFSLIVGTGLLLAVLLALLFLPMNMLQGVSDDPDLGPPYTATKSSRPTIANTSTEYQSKVLLMGGYHLNDTTASVESYGNCSDNTEDLPEPTHAAAAAVLEQSVFHCGGYIHLSYISTCYIREDTRWIPGPTMVYKRYFFTLNTVGTRLVAVGGYPLSNSTNSVEVLDSASSTWTRQDYTLDVQRTQHCTVTISNMTVMLIGGFFSITTQLLNIDTGSVTSYADLPYTTKLIGAGCSLNDGLAILTGGGDGTSSSRAVYTLDPSDTGNAWKFAGTMVKARAYHTMQILNGVPTVFGGYNKEDSKLPSLEENINGVWREKPLSQCRDEHSSVVISC